MEMWLQISIAYPSQPSTSTDNTFAYRPNFADYHQSGLAGVFLNLENIFPCISGEYPICRMFTYEEDGFNKGKGKAIIEAADSGNNFSVFSCTEDILTYGFAFQGCSQLNGLDGCLRKYFQRSITCQLPRESCGTLNWASSPDWTVYGIIETGFVFDNFETATHLTWLFEWMVVALKFWLLKWLWLLQCI